MERHFDEELVFLRKDILIMASMVESAIAASIEALKQSNRGSAEEVIARDTNIDQYEVKIVNACVSLLALRQPMAVDLRFITMAMQINTDLERMGDLAVDIAQRVLDLVDKPLLKPLVDIPQLSVIACEMTRDVIKAFLNDDVDLAKKIILRDREADDLRNRVQSELINDYMLKDCSTVPRALPLLLVARHLERICDHATNIAEDIIYIAQAKIVKHRLEGLDDIGL
ncbi:MAG TPA: phosphate signaling complex protein PhoU [Candidatus Omnitrophota bacterium]|nr:phosphate signaling complex protein PhoU [Candidatus Omnitrophota bacterium]HQJ15902.1 phosphate signaling complex protein PhoU [Candidatus Omnitrophota bacterium]